LGSEALAGIIDQELFDERLRLFRDAGVAVGSFECIATLFDAFVGVFAGFCFEGRDANEKGESG
jgi:hypothetical protein